MIMALEILALSCLTLALAWVYRRRSGSRILKIWAACSVPELWLSYAAMKFIDAPAFIAVTGAAVVVAAGYGAVMNLLPAEKGLQKAAEDRRAIRAKRDALRTRFGLERTAADPSGRQARK